VWFKGQFILSYPKLCTKQMKHVHECGPSTAYYSWSTGLVLINERLLVRYSSQPRDKSYWRWLVGPRVDTVSLSRLHYYSLVSPVSTIVCSHALQNYSLIGRQKIFDIIGLGILPMVSDGSVNYLPKLPPNIMPAKRAWAWLLTIEFLLLRVLCLLL